MEKCIFIGYPAGYKGWKFYNPTTKKTIISERAEFDERYFPGLKRSSTSLPLPLPSSLSLLPPATSTHPPTFIDPGPVLVEDDDQVTPAAHPGGEEPIAGQPEPAVTVPDLPVAPKLEAAPEDFVLPPALQPPPPARPRRQYSLIPPAPYPPPLGKRVRRPVHHGLPPPLAPAPVPVPRPVHAPPVLPASPSPDPPSPSPPPSNSDPVPGPSHSTRHFTRSNLGVPPGEWWKVR